VQGVELQLLGFAQLAQLVDEKLSLAGTAHQEEVEKLFVIHEDQEIVH
jgi:hypothetical protein